MPLETIPLNKLSVSKINVRKTGAEIDLDELQSSIVAHGLLNPLTVQKSAKGKHEIIAGQRRFLALRALAKEGAIKADHGVECNVVADDADATEISLAENVVRTQMHPADQFEAWCGLIDKGSSVADVAARFGVSEPIVVKRLKLGRVSPKLLDIYRKGDMTLEQVQALTLTDDHVAQESAWEGAEHAWQRNPGQLRGALTTGEVSADDKRVKFIGGIETYEAAGGKVRRDLFDDQNAGYISDLTLLNSLVVRQLEAAAAEVRSEGWKWVEVTPQFDWEAVKGFGRVQEGHLALTPEQEARLSELGEQYDELESWSEQDDLDDEQTAKFEQIETEMQSLQATQKIYISDDISRAGCYVSIGYQGEPEIRRGYVKPEDMPQAAAKSTASGEAVATEEAETDGLSASLIESLTAERTAALRIELARSPKVALAAVVHRLVLTTFKEKHGSSRQFDRSFKSCLGISLSSQSPEASNGSTKPQASSELDDIVKTWSAILPSGNDELWTWCLAQTQERLLELLAVCAAQSVNAIVHKRVASADRAEVAHADALAHALDLDMTKWFTPTAENYFSRVSKPTIIKALVEMDGGTPVAPVTEKLKKGALAEFAEKAVGASGWLPELLRAQSAEAEAEPDALEDAA